MSGKKQNLNPMWKKLMNLIDLGEPTSFLPCVLGMHSTNESVVDEYRLMFESRISARATEKKLRGWEEIPRVPVAWLFWHERYCDLANERLQHVLWSLFFPN